MINGEEVWVQLQLPCPSPCIKKCGTDDTLRCSGCLRTGKEVASWYQLDDASKWNLLLDILNRRGGPLPLS